MRDYHRFREWKLFTVLAVAGVAAALIHVDIPHTDVVIDGRWCFGFIGFALLRRWWAALALTALLSFPYGTPDIALRVGFCGNMLYAVPALLTIRPLAAWMLRRWGAGWQFGLGWLVLVLFCYQVFMTPAVWGVVALLEDRPAVAGILDGWRTQPFLSESVLVALFSAATLVATLAVGRLNAERRRLQGLTKSLSASEQTTRALLNATADAAFLIDNSGTILAANDEIARRLGQDRQAIVGTNIYSLLPPEVATRRREWIEQVVRSGQPLKEEDERAGRVMHHSLYPVLDDAAGVRAVAVFVRDITHERHTEKELRESEARFRSYVEHSPYGVFVADGQGRYVDVNPASVRITGYTAEQLTAMRITDLIRPESREAAAAHFLRLTKTGDATTEVAFVRADGSTGRWTVAATRIGPDRYLGFVDDITERRKREERITVLGRMLDDAPTAITIHDTDGNFLFSNRQNMLMHGYDHADEFLSINLHQLDVPASKALLAERVQQIAERGEARFEVEHYRRDGSTFPLEVLAKRIEWDGQPAILSIAADISERKQAEATLRESEQRFQTILSLVPDMISIQDAEMNILYSNWNGFASVPEEQRILNTKCYRTYRGFDQMCPDCNALQVLETGEAVWREVQLPDKTWVDLRVIPVLDEDGAVELFVEWVRDITEWKQTEQALRESEERFRKLLQDLPVLAVQGYRADGTTIYWNKGSEVLYGYTAEEAVGRSLLDLIIPAGMRDSVQRNVREMARTGAPHPPSELQLLRKDGSVVEVFSSHMVLQREGYPPELFCLDLDLTDIKRAQAERERLQEQLAQSQKLESIGRLAGGVAHDFNNLLMGIMNYVDLCRDEVGEAHPIQSWLDEIKHETKRSADIVRQLLAFARKQTIAPQIINLNDAVENMLKMLRRLIGEDIDLVWEPGAELREVHVDPGQVDQILANLCVNARDAIEGTGKVTIETENVSIDAAYCAEHEGFQPGDFVMLAVSDDGCGMDRDTLEHIFEPFYTTKGIGQGTGLGLATLYGIARQNDGFVNVYSEPAKGTTFRIYLPRFEGGEHTDAEHEKKVETIGGNETILLVEDEKSIRVTMGLFLEKLGYTVVAAEDPEQAMPLVNDHNGTIDLLIADVVMPGMSGRDLADKLQADHSDMRVLYISGYTANVIAHRGVLEDGVDFLSKPIPNEQLARKVRQVLDRA